MKISIEVDEFINSQLGKSATVISQLTGKTSSKAEVIRGLIENYLKTYINDRVQKETAKVIEHNSDVLNWFNRMFYDN